MSHPIAGPLQFESGRTHFSGWINAATFTSADAMARSGFDSVIFDLQHGPSDAEGVRAGILAAASRGVPSIARVTVGGYELAARMLDAGAQGVICPMIDTVAEAEAFVATVKYPPVGRRSWGPYRAVELSGHTRDTYLGAANDLVKAFAMCETEESLQNLERIMQVRGLDGVFIGPNDLAVSLTRGVSSDPNHPKVIAGIEHVLILARRYQKVAGIYSNTPAHAVEYARRGFRLVTLGNEHQLLEAGARAALQQARGESANA